jgi:outer membrane protein assembly factor BamA
MKPDLLSEIVGDSRLPVAEQKQIAASIQRRTYRAPLDTVTEEVQERLRAEWQNRGYFKVQVSGDAKTLTSSPANERVALTVRLTEGPLG